MNDSQNDEDGGIETTHRTFTILETLRDHDGATISELARRMDLPKSTVFRHVKTLNSLGYVVDIDGEQYLSFRFLEFSEQARTRETGYTAAKEKVFELGQETDERALLLVEEQGEGVYVHRTGDISDPMIGKRRPLHSLACGKTILAAKSDDEIEEYVAKTELEKHTDNTVTDPEALFEELETIRERGYAVNEQEYMDGLAGVAVPVYTPEDDCLGGLGVFGPTSRFGEEYVHEELPSRLRDKAGEIRVTLAYS